MKKLALHPEIKVNRFYLGEEKAPLLVIDNLLAASEELVREASARSFSPAGRAFPGIRASAPLEYQEFLAHELYPLLTDFFSLQCSRIGFSMCHYSLVTAPPQKLSMIQRIPHVDSFSSRGLATVHYLFQGDKGGTAFYRHKATGFETLDEERKLVYFKSLEAENDGPNMPPPAYINGDTELFARIAQQEGIFNRIVIYRRNSLHSGSIAPNFLTDSNPATGRLTLNSFIDPME